MRIYTKIVLDMATGAVREAEWFEHSGPVAQCKGGGKGGGGSVQDNTMMLYMLQQAQFNQQMQRLDAQQAEQNRQKAESEAKEIAERQAEQKRRDDLRRQMLGYSNVLGEDDEDAAVSVNTLG